MAKQRHVVLSAKMLGSEALLAPATMQDLGLEDNDSLTITSLAYHHSTPVVGNKLTGINEIKLPRKIAATLKEGERLTVQKTPPAAPPPPQPAQPPQTLQHQVSTDVEWDPIPEPTMDEVAGMETVKERIEQALFYLSHPEWFLIRKSLPPRVFLFFGPYGCGKTMIAKAMVSKLAFGKNGGSALSVKLKSIRPSDIKDPYLGMSAKRVQAYLNAARKECNNGSTVVLLLDEIDSLVSNRADKGSHEEYRDVVNSIIQDVQGVQELETEARIRKLWQDPEVNAVRNELAKEVRKSGKRDGKGDIWLKKEHWTPKVEAKMRHLRKRIMDTGGVSTVIIVGTSNDPCRVDEALLSRAGDNVFFVARPSADAINGMLHQQLDSAFVELSGKERKSLAEEAFCQGLTGRDIMLSWLQPLRNMSPGSLTITGYQTIQSLQPHPIVGIEWEMDLFKRLNDRGHQRMAKQVAEYLRQVGASGAPSVKQANGVGAGMS